MILALKNMEINFLYNFGTKIIQKINFGQEQDKNDV